MMGNGDNGVPAQSAVEAALRRHFGEIDSLLRLETEPVPIAGYWFSLG